MLDENNNNFHGQNIPVYDFTTFNKVAAEEDVKPSLQSLKLTSLNCLIFVQINVNSIRNKFELHFYLGSNNIDVLLISEIKTNNAFPVS